MMRGYGKRLFPLVGVAPPFTPGRDVIGEVVELGPLAWEFTTGDMVAAAIHPTSDGAHADLVACAETAAARLPAGVDFPSVAGVPFASLTGWRAVCGLASVQV